MAKITEDKATFYGKIFNGNVQLTVEKGQKKEGNNYVYDEDKEGKVTLFLDQVKDFKDKQTGEVKYIVNLPIALINELINAKNSNEEGFGKMFDKCVANGKVWEIVSMIRKGSSEETVKGYVKDLKLPQEVIEKAYAIVNAKPQEA
ncbi:hypothetical protein HNP88_000361 [Methanococcus maripaludis]|uniref:Uncharacterized protein n=1 Tax=Methanococcus maripaludis TaxID=39152 RepID=A0A7J9NL60_METMI|nr:hypothetical protein [Methanococcus maripaludis]MBA2846177.1 hypothetical protein [Methanococcus maripaludis]